MKNLPVRFYAILAIALAAISIPVAINAWGPERPTFTIQNPIPTYVVFNSITNNPNIGDERNFVGIRESGTTGKWSDKVTVQEGKEYTVRMYVHNNAADNLNLVAENVTAKFDLPAETGKQVRVTGFLSASNIGANNKGDKGAYSQIWDHADFVSDSNFNVALVPGSIKYQNNSFGANGVSLSDSLLTSTGVKLGYNSLNGQIPGCFQYAGYVTFRVKPQIQKTLDFTLSKKVSKHGENKWVDSYNANPGEVVDFMLVYKNTGTAQNDDVTFRDTLPTGLNFVNDSAKWSNSIKQNVPITGNKLVNGTGVNAGSYAPGANAYIIFSAKVADNDKLPTCGANKLLNKAKVTTGGYSIEDDATVTVNKECEPEAIVTCDALTVTKLERTKFKFDTKYTIENATLKHITYVVKDASGKEIYRGTNKEFATNTVGKYTVQSYVTATVKNSDKTVTSEGCKKEFEVVKEKTPAIKIEKTVNDKEHDKVEVGKPFTYQVKVTNTGEVDLKDAKVTDKAPTNVKFISADKGTITDNQWSYTISSLKVGQSETFNIKAEVTKEVEGNIRHSLCRYSNYSW